MSMVESFVALEPQQLQALIAEPESLDSFLYPDDPDQEPEHQIDLDKAWHAIHFTLTGSVWEGAEPLYLVILGGTEFGEDYGYGPPRYLTPDQVKAVSSALEPLTPDVFSGMFDSDALTREKIYPKVFWASEEDGGLEYVLDNYLNVREFYRTAAERGDAMIVSMA